MKLTLRSKKFQSKLKSSDNHNKNIFAIHFGAMIFKVISHFFLNKTHLITGSSNITSSENLAEKTAVFGRSQNKPPFIFRQKSRLFGISSIYN